VCVAAKHFQVKSQRETAVGELAPTIETAGDAHSPEQTSYELMDTVL
jgi:hypothetical protein